MSDPLHVTAGELDAEEILAALEAGRRVVVRTKVMGVDYDVTLRHDGTVYYCDTPTTLHRHESRAGMLECLTNQGYVEHEETIDD